MVVTEMETITTFSATTECFNPENPNVVIDNTMSRAEYIDCYLKPFIDYFQHNKDGFVAQKILAQLHLQESHLGDPDTWLILPKDKRSLENVINHYAGRPMWISSAVDCDFSDPIAVERSSKLGIRPTKPLLYRGPSHSQGITHVSELDGFYRALDKYHYQHPQATIQALKIFPQDLQQTAIARTVIHRNGINFRQNLKTLNAREDENRAKYIDLEIVWPFADLSPVIIANKITDAQYLAPFVNSIEKWHTFRELMAEHYQNVNPVAPEFMVHNPGESTAKILFFSDINASSKPGNFSQSPLLNSSSLTQLLDAPIISRDQHHLIPAIDALSLQLPETADHWGIHPGDVSKINDAITTLIPHIPAWSLLSPEVLFQQLSDPHPRSLAQVHHDLHAAFPNQPTLKSIFS